MQYTTNYGLTKLELSDSPADITKINDNWETIDEKLKEHADMLDGTTGNIAFTDEENTFTKPNTFSGTTPYINFSHQNLTKGTNPDSTLYQTIYFKDKTNADSGLLGFVQNAVQNSGNVISKLTAYANIAENSDKGEIGVTIKPDGTATGFSPTPPVSSDTNEIATTEWVRDRIPELAPEPDLSDYVKSVNNVTPDPSGNVTLDMPDFVPSGTKMLFYEAAAPTGWTKVTGIGNRAVKIVEDTTGGITGGSVNFSDAFKNITSSNTTVTISGNTGNRQLTVAMLASHNHQLRYTDVGSNSFGSGTKGDDGYGTIVYTTSTGSNGTHNHTFSGSSSHTHTVNLAVKYINVIVCKKD